MKKIRSNIVFRHLDRSNKRIIIEQGGTRSGKTYNILMWLIFGYALKQTSKKVVTICRKTYPALRTSAMRDFIQILQDYELYDERNHNKSSAEYILNGNLIEFISLDQPQKVRGRKRDLLFINEANELHWEDWQQLVFRTTGKIILDYNPSDEFHWIYEKVKTRDDSEFHITTYKNNPFLPQSIKDEIELLKKTDENYWQVYGLGQVGVGKTLVFTHTGIDKVPLDALLLSYGMDFGYTNDPTTLVAVYKKDNNLYFDELIYRTGMTNRDIGNELRALDIDRRAEIYADSAEPKSIVDLRQMGWNVKPSEKGRDSVNIGIDMLKRYNLFVTHRSVNMIKEFRNYKWKEDKSGNVLNTPVDLYNHTTDAIRYACYSKLSRPNFGRYAIR